MASTARRLLESVINVAVVFALLVVVFLVYKNLIRPRLLSRNAAAVLNQASPKVGDFVSSGGRPLVDQKGGLVFVIRQGCIYCSESMPFYRDLVKAHVPTEPSLIFLMPGPKEANIKYLKSNLGTEGDVRIYNPHSFHVSGTPTLVLLDSSSHIQKVWVGKLSPSQETDVETAIKMASEI